MSEPAPPSLKPDWSNDDLLKHWRRGKLELPFTATERSETETQQRILAIAALTGVAISLTILGLLAWAGAFPEIHRVPNVTNTGDHSALWWVIPGAGLIGAVIILVLMSSVFFQRASGDGHPYSFEATDQTFTIRTLHGHVFTGPWADWRLESYDALHLPKGGRVLSVLYLSLNGRELPVRMMDQKQLSRFLRMVVQKVAG